jgi:DNA-binding NarL/FixJ family response regulator
MDATHQTLKATTAVADGTGINITGPAGAAVRVWLVDDNDQFRTLVADTLGRGHGIECARQFASPDALLSALASRAGPDVILLDVQLGDQNGLDVVRPIKSLTRSTRVVMFTTCYDPESRERAFNDGASDYLLKTDPLQKLIECIHRPAGPAPSLRRRRQSPGSRPSGTSPARTSVGRLGGSSSRSLVRALRSLRSLWN